MVRQQFSGRAFDEYNYMWYSATVRVVQAGKFTKFFTVHTLASSMGEANLNIQHYVSTNAAIQAIGIKGSLLEWEEHFNVKVENPCEEPPRVERSKLI